MKKKKKLLYSCKNQSLLVKNVYNKNENYFQHERKNNDFLVLLMTVQHTKQNMPTLSDGAWVIMIQTIKFLSVKLMMHFHYMSMSTYLFFSLYNSTCVPRVYVVRSCRDDVFTANHTNIVVIHNSRN